MIQVKIVNDYAPRYFEESVNKALQELQRNPGVRVIEVRHTVAAGNDTFYTAMIVYEI